MNNHIAVLYAEDNPGDADLTKAYFQHQAPEFSIKVVSSGEVCLEELARNQYDVLLLDNQLTDMNGIDVLRQLIRERQQIPVVMVTGLGDEELAVQALRAGAWDYVPKRREYLSTLPSLLKQVVADYRRKLAAGENIGPRVKNILYIEHDEMDIDLTRKHFESQAPYFTLHTMNNAASALKLLQENHRFDAVLVDLRMTDMSALDFLHEARRLSICCPYIVLTGKGDEEAARASLKLGAYDYILKRDDYLTRLVYAIEHAIAIYQLNVVNRKLLDDLEELNKSLEQKVADRTTKLQIEINERKRTEAALRESEKRYKQLLKSVTDYIYTVEIKEGRPVKTIHGRGCEAVTGYTPEEYQVNPALWLQMVYPDDREIVEEQARRLLHGEEAPAIEHRIFHKNGSVRWVRNTCVLRHNAAGELISYDGLVKNITERKQMEEALRQSESKVRSIIEHSNELFYIHDTNHQFTFVSPQSQQILGYPPDEMMIKWTELITDHPINAIGFKLTEKALATGERQPPYLLEVRRKDGEKAWIEVDESPLRDENNQVVGIVGAARDVTRRKRAEEALRESEEKFRSLVETTSDWIWEVNAEGVYTYSSPKVKTLLGYEPEEILGRTPFMLMPAAEAEKVASQFQNFVAARQPFRGLININQTKDGRLVVLESSGVPLMTVEGRFIGYRGIDRDITERTRAEEALLESEMKFRTLVEESLVGVYVIQDGYFSYVNPELARIFRYTIEELTEHFPVENLVAVEDRPVVAENIRRRVSGETPSLRYEFRGLRKNGSVINVEVHGARTIFRGKPAVIGMLVDVTERKRAEEAIRESEGRYRSLFEYSPISLWIEDFSELRSYLERLRQNGVTNLRAYLEQRPEEAIYCLNLIKILDVNKTTLTIYGAKNKSELLKGFEPMIGPEITAAHIESILAVAEGKKHFEIETVNYTLKKRKIHISLRWDVMPSYEKTYGRVLVSILDITERKQAELRLQESERRFRMAVNNYPSPFVIYDAKRRLQFVNAVGVKISGYQNNALLGKRDEELFPAEITRYYLTTLKKAVRTRQPQSTECTFELANKKFTIIANYVPLLNDDGKIREILGITHDITESKRVEEELKTRARQQQALVKLGERALLGESLETLMQEAARFVAAALNVKYCKILEPMPDGSFLLLRAGVGWKKGYVGKAKVSADKQSQAGYTLQVDAPVIVNDLKTEKRFNGPPLLHDHNVISGISVIIGDHKSPFGVLGVHTDEPRQFTENDVRFLQSIAHILATVIDRKRSEKQIRDSLEEKEVLLKEIHHRVKNNMQVISSLLNLQARKISDPRSKEAFTESQNRIRSMALIHERLYLSKDFARIEFANYIRNLTSHLMRVYNIDPGAIKLRLNLEPAVLSIDAAIPCGLIVNELVANSMKHAFPNGKKGEIGIELLMAGNGAKIPTPERVYNLIIKDNGVGLPKNFRLEKSATLGLRLVNTLVKQISGTLKLIRRNGTQYKITFKAK